MKRSRVIGVVLVALVLGAAALALADKLLVRRKYEQRIEDYRAEARIGLSEFIRLREALTDGPFSAALPGGDAGPFLNPRVVWKTLGGAVVRGDPAFAVPDELAAKLSTGGTRWWTEGRTAPPPTLDSEWIRQLGEYGHWNLLPGSPILEQEMVSSASMPLVDHVTLRRWAQIRLLQANHLGSLSDTVPEVLHFARLVFSTETLLGEVTGLRILEDLVQVAPESFPEWDEETVQRHRAAVLLANGYHHVMLPLDVVEQALPADRVIPGRCSALTEFAGTAVWMRQALGASFEGRFQAFERQLAKPPAGCRLELARHLASIPQRSGTDPFQAFVAMNGERYPFSGMGALVDHRVAMLLVSMTGAPERFGAELQAARTSATGPNPQ